MVNTTRCFAFVIILVFAGNRCLAQDIETLKSNLLETQSDTVKVKTLARIGFRYAFTDLDSSRNYSLSAIELARKIGYKKGEASGLNNLAISYDVSGQYEKALELYMQAKKLHEETNNKRGLADIYNNCGMVYEALGDIERAMECHVKSLAMERELRDTIGVAYSEIHVAGVHVLSKQYDQALPYYNSAKETLEILGDTDGLSFVYLGLGELFLEQSLPQKAIEQCTRAYEAFEGTNNKKGMAEASLIAGRAYLNTREYQKSRSHLKLARQLAGELEGKEIEGESLLTLVELNRNVGDFEGALSIYEEYVELDRASRMDAMERYIKEMDARFNLEKKEQEILLLSSEKEFQKSMRNVFVGALLIILIVMAFLYRAYNLSIKRASMLRIKNREIRGINKEVREERKNALEAAKAKSEFLSIMSHEIRTPMNAVIGATHLLFQQDPNPEQVENLRTLKFSADNLLLLINDILDLSKIESNKVELERVSFDLHELCESIFSTHMSQVDSSRVDLILKYAHTQDNNYIGDAGRLGQILNNLMSNAIKFTEQGNIKLSVSFQDSTKSTTLVGIEVSDTGIGIPTEKMDIVFNSFSQADSDTTRKYGGTGLGLYITKRILELFGSEIKVESKFGEGSKFYFQLELEKDLSPKLEDINDDEAKIAALSGTKVLVVDDDKTNLVIARGVLNRWGMNVVTADGGKEALEKLKQAKFDIVLLDLRMPDMDGYAVADSIRSSQRDFEVQVPIIALSANSMQDGAQDAKHHGMDDYLTKPFDPNKLLDTLYQYVCMGEEV